MKRGPLNFLVDLVLAGLFVTLLATGYVMKFVLPPGTHPFLRLWGLNRHGWGDVHFWVSVSLVGILLVHLGLHWQWVVSMARSTLLAARGAPTHLVRTGVLTLVVAVVCLTLFAWAAHSCVRETTDTKTVPPPDQEAGKGLDTGPTPAGEQDPSKVDFRKEVYPIFEKSCLRCHGPKKQLGDFRADRREDFFTREGKKPLVIPGKSADSPLIVIVSGARPDMLMAEQHRLPEGDVQLVRAWIDAGAPWPPHPNP